jgi:hypothetical protein
MMLIGACVLATLDFFFGYQMGIVRWFDARNGLPTSSP